MFKKFVLIFFACMGKEVYCQQLCECANVRVVPVDLYQFAEAEPLFSQVASTATESLNIDNVCYTAASNNYGVIDMAMAITFQNNSTSTTFLRQIELEPGVFEISGDSDFRDFILGEPCKNTFVIYRCFTQRLPCPTNVDTTIVIIESSKQFESKRCINRGIEIAQRQFPGMRFYTLPRMLDTNCEPLY